VKIRLNGTVEECEETVDLLRSIMLIESVEPVIDIRSAGVQFCGAPVTLMSEGVEALLNRCGESVETILRRRVGSRPIAERGMTGPRGSQSGLKNQRRGQIRRAMFRVATRRGSRTCSGSRRVHSARAACGCRRTPRQRTGGTVRRGPRATPASRAASAREALVSLRCLA